MASLLSSPADLASVNIDVIRSELAVEGTKPEKHKATSSKTDIEEAEKRAFERGLKEGFASGRRAGLADAVEAIHKIGQPSGRYRAVQLVADSAKSQAVKDAAPITRASGGAELRVLRVLAARHPARFTKAAMGHAIRHEATPAEPGRPIPAAFGPLATPGNQTDSSESRSQE